MKKLRIRSIFGSIDGEVNKFGQGSLTVFVRFAGCNLRCKFGEETCDTPYALDAKSANLMCLDDVIEKVESFSIKKLTITGGEPLLTYDELWTLAYYFYQKNYQISIETNGSLSPQGLSQYANIVMDYKLPSSGEEEKMNLDFWSKLDEGDIIKFVCLDGYDFARAVQLYNLNTNKNLVFAFSPVYGQLDPILLLKWMREANLPRAILSVQLHKILGLVEPN